MEIKILRPDDAAVLVAVGPDVFDAAVDPRVTTEFLNDPRQPALMTMTPDWRQIEWETRNLSITSAVFLGEGWASRAYLVNDEFVFRFPKRQAWDELDREIKFLAFAADHLPLADRPNPDDSSIIVVD